MIKVGVLGAKGRMGSQVCSTVEAAGDLQLAAQVDIGDSLDSLAAADVVVDFTHPGAVMDNLRWCIGRGAGCGRRHLRVRRGPARRGDRLAGRRSRRPASWSCLTSRSARC